MKRILVATDGSESADRAVDYAASLARREKADLLIANVIGGLPDDVFARLIDAEQASLKEMLESMSAKTLTKARERARAAGAATIQLESRTGSAGGEAVGMGTSPALASRPSAAKAKYAVRRRWPRIPADLR
jgi:nucleotide-binding universal stress UspA family protein